MLTREKQVFFTEFFFEWKIIFVRTSADSNQKRMPVLCWLARSRFFLRGKSLKIVFCGFFWGKMYMTHLYMGHDSFISGTWPIHVRDVTDSYVWHDSFACATWLIHMWDMTHSHVGHDSFITDYICTGGLSSSCVAESRIECRGSRVEGLGLEDYVCMYVCILILV